ncbi:MAG: Undecaprenyl-diphosphatase [Xanthomonadales bacterium]|nr:Undecaprenyl-diphosphatase [Xanthomonadales bacterium]
MSGAGDGGQHKRFGPRAGNAAARLDRCRVTVEHARSPAGATALDFPTVLLLALIQALTEFLPISSSAHLYLAGEWFGPGYQGLVFDLGLHLGTLLAVLVYFRRDWFALAHAAWRWRAGRPLDREQRLLLGLLLATIPGGLAALALGDAGATALRSYLVIGCTQIVFGALLYHAFARSADSRTDERGLTIGRAVLVGCAQALALVPGVSRSGITMTAGLLLGLERQAAARFSFLLAVPITTAAALHGVAELLKGGQTTDVGSFWLGAAISCVAGLGCIHCFLATIRRIGMLPFFAYRLGLGLLLLGLAFAGPTAIR